MTERATAAIVLAAGKGTRMRSDRAKVLFLLHGRPLVEHVLDAARDAGIGRVVLVIGHQHQRVRDALRHREAEFVVQHEQLGTGHAVQCALPEFRGFQGDVVVLAGDAPLVRASTLTRLLEHHRQSEAAVTVLTARIPDPTGYGRILRDGDGRITGIVEHKDAGEDERRVDEINSSIYAFTWSFLAQELPRLKNDNEQGEYYLTDTVRRAFERRERVEGVLAGDAVEVLGVNTPEQLEDAARILADRES